MAIPLFVSAIQKICRHPLTIFEFLVWNNYRTNPAGRWKLAFIRLSVFFSYIFVPSVSISNKEKAMLRRRVL